MFLSPRRYLLIEGKAVEATPGLSGTLLVGEGCEMSEDDAIKYGLLDKKSHPDVLVAPINLVKEETKTVAPVVAKPWDAGSSPTKEIHFGTAEPSALSLDKID